MSRAVAARVITGSIQGGELLRKHLVTIERRLGRGASVRVGFFEGATYPPVHGLRGTKRSPIPVAQAAFWNEFGTSGSPPRPFIRNMVASKSPRWGIGLGLALRSTNYDARAALRIMGEGIAGQLVQSIVNFHTPPNAPNTVAIKGFNKPLIDEGIMQRAVDFQVIEDEP